MGVDMEEAMEIMAVCTSCGSVGLVNGGDGHFYCVICGFQSQDLLEQAHEDHDFDFAIDRRYVLHCPESNPQSNPELLSRLQTLAAFQRLTQSQPDYYGYGDDPSKPSLLADGLLEQPYPLDFAPPLQQQKLPPPDEAEVAVDLRSRYLEGLQVMMQMQCEALVEKFGISPLICGIVPSIWFRVLGASRVLDEQWHQDVKLADDVATMERYGEGPRYSLKHRNSSRYKADLRTEYGKKTVRVWIRTLKGKIPLSSSLAICFLACHISREAVLPTDVVKWAVEGKMPYLSAFVDIDKYLGSSLNMRSVNSSLLFQPTEVIDSWQLEALAGSIAERIGLHLPPVNFFSIANRYLKLLPVFIDKVLPHACNIYEWLMPPDLWLPAHPYRLPSRACVMSILIVAIRLVYNINGCFHWERYVGLLKKDHRRRKSKKSHVSSFGDDMGSPRAADDTSNDSRTTKSHSSVRSLLHVKCSDSDTIDLLQNLETTYKNITNGHGYSKDLPTYLEYCKDVVFAGKTTSYDEENLITHLWNHFNHQEEGIGPSESTKTGCAASKSLVVHKTYAGEAYLEGTSVNMTPARSKRRKNSIQYFGQKYSQSNSSKRALRYMKSDMEKNGFTYSCFRRRRSTSTYLHYKRKLIHGRLRYLVHADYYILLRTCARIVEIDARILHLGLLKLERRLRWIEERVDCSLPSFF